MRGRPRVLVFEPDSDALSSATSVLSGTGFDVTAAASRDEALKQAQGGDFDVILLKPPPEESADLDALTELSRAEDPPAVLVMSDVPSPEAAVRAIELDSLTFVGQPELQSSLVNLVRRASQKRALEMENAALRRAASLDPVSEAIISESEAMKRVVERVGQVADSSASVLIVGETGSGKGLVARALHDTGSRADQPFIRVNCAALQEPLLESELFGHQKGAFTGAVATKPGLFEAANRGTLFLDEIAEMSAAMQAKLLQVLDSGELRRVGSTHPQSVDVRVVAATQLDLEKETKAGRFRQDLYYRLNVVTIAVPPLRERKEDIPPLVEHYLARCHAPTRAPKQISRGTVRLLMEYHWPGNARELRNVIESMCLLSPGPRIVPEDLPTRLQPFGNHESQALEIPLPLVEIERLHILRALDHTNGKKAPAARLLGIDVKTLSNKVKSYKIEL